MESISVLSVISAVLVLVIVASGIWLRRSGVPYKKGILVVHKLSVLAAVVLTIVIYRQHFDWFKIWGTGLVLFLLSDSFLVIAFVTGVLLSFDRFVSVSLKIIHRFVSWSVFLFIPVIWLYCH